MSYDYRCCLAKEGRSAEDIANSDVAEAAPLTPEAEERNRRLIAALTATNPALEVTSFDGGVELSAVEQGIQVGLFANEASVNIAYWEHGPTGDLKVLQQARVILQILQREGGFFVYDPQLGRVIDPNEDIGFDSNSFEKVRGYLDDSASAAKRRSWWQFWQ